MKPEIKESLNDIECEQDSTVHCIKKKVEGLEASDVGNITDAIKRLNNMINHITLESQKCLGCYYLLLGCVHHENGDIPNATLSLKKSISELGYSHQSKAAAHCLLSENYSKTKQYVKAVNELREAQKILKSHKRTASHLAYKQNQRQSSMEERIKKRLDDLSSKIFLDEEPPKPNPRKPA
jgi:tetratricopeptide (TPR) repeat protein